MHEKTIRYVTACLLFTACGLNGSPSKDYHFISSEESRNLIALPLVNETGDPRLDYMQTGIWKMLSGDLEKIGSVTAAYPEIRFQARPYPDSKKSHLSLSSKKLPLHVSIRELNSNLTELNRYKTALEKARFLNADYLLYGYFSGDAKGEIQLSISLFHSATLEEVHFSYKKNVNDLYESLSEVGRDLQKEFIQSGKISFKVTTPEPGAMVYLNEDYLGKTPLETSIFPGKYLLIVEQEGRGIVKRKIDLEKNKDASFNIKNILLENKGMLEVTSDPSGADVFLNITHIGQTPLFLDNLPEGTHRIRISKEGYVDRFLGVRITEKKSTKINFKLNKGDTVKYFNDPHYVILDWTNNDFSFYSLISSIPFYAGYLGFHIQADRIRDSIRSEVLAFGLADLPHLTPYEYYRLEENNKRAIASERNASVSAGAGAVAVLLAGAFLWRDLTLEGKEAGEVSQYKPSWIFDCNSFQAYKGGREEKFSMGMRIFF